MVYHCSNFRENGARVAINDVASQEEIEKAVEIKRARHRSPGIHRDVTKKKRLKPCTGYNKHWGQIDILRTMPGLQETHFLRMKDED